MPAVNLTDPTNGTPTDANLIANNNNALETVINGGLDNNNIAAAAAIAVSKLAAGSDGQVLKTVGTTPTWGAAGVTVATTVAGLGAGFSGAQGMLRLGSSPYDFISLVYDATYGKWVSAAKEWHVSGATNVGVGVGTYADAAYAGSTLGEMHVRVPWRGFDTAGLLPQFRVLVSAVAVSGDTGGIQPAYASQDAGAVFTASVGIAAGAVAGFNNGTYQLKDTGWHSIAGGYTVKDFIVPSMQSYASTTAGRVAWRDLALMMRWVSA